MAVPEPNPEILLEDSTSGDTDAYVLRGFVQRVEVSVQEDEAEGGVVILDEFPGTTIKLFRPGDGSMILKHLDAFSQYATYPAEATAVRSGIFTVTNGSHVTVKVFHRYPK